MGKRIIKPPLRYHDAVSVSETKSAQNPPRSSVSPKQKQNITSRSVKSPIKQKQIIQEKCHEKALKSKATKNSVKQTLSLKKPVKSPIKQKQNITKKSTTVDNKNVKNPVKQEQNIAKKTVRNKNKVKKDIAVPLENSSNAVSKTVPSLKGIKVNLIRYDFRKISDFSSIKRNVQTRDGDKKADKDVGNISQVQELDKTSSKKQPTMCKTITKVKGKALRARKPVKYAESSIEMSQSEEQTQINVQSKTEANAKKIPIYQQVINHKEPVKRKGDQYEFDSDSEKYKKRKKPKLEDSSFDEYNKTIQEILKKIVKRKDFRKKKLVKTLDKQENNNHESLVEHKKKTQTKNQNLISLHEHLPLKSTVTSVPTQKKTVLQLPQSSTLEHNPNNNINLNFAEDPAVDDNEANNSDDEYFGFAISENRPQIKIISDIQLKPKEEFNVSITSPSWFKNGQPDANSTMRNILTPWRFNEINIRRNPHFLSLKQSSLPHINQDMVLDHTIVDKLNETSKMDAENVNPRTSAVKKTQAQAKIVDYFKGSKIEDKENQENCGSALFDCNLLSPIKNMSKSTNRGDLARRKILGEINDNRETNTVSNNTLLENLNESTLPKGNADYTNFGFDTTDEVNQLDSPTKEKNDRPFRFSVNVNDKKYQRKRVQKAESEVEESSCSESDNDEECENGQIKLFEDFVTTKEALEQHDTKVLKRKRRRKNIFNDDTMDYQRHKRRKDVRTKQEEEEAEKWAEAFNSMCAEVEQFPLEIE